MTTMMTMADERPMNAPSLLEQAAAAEAAGDMDRAIALAKEAEKVPYIALTDEQIKLRLKRNPIA